MQQVAGTVDECEAARLFFGVGGIYLIDALRCLVDIYACKSGLCSASKMPRRCFYVGTRGSVK